MYDVYEKNLWKEVKKLKQKKKGRKVISAIWQREDSKGYHTIESGSIVGKRRSGMHFSPETVASDFFDSSGGGKLFLFHKKHPEEALTGIVITRKNSELFVDHVVLKTMHQMRK